MRREHFSAFVVLFFGLAATLSPVLTASTDGDLAKAAVPARQVLRIALIPGNGDRAVADATTAIVEATLTGMPDVELLERDQIKKILAEQKLSASGLLDPSAAINLGKLIRAEVFLILERAGEQNISATLLETSTGVSLAAEIFGGDGAPDEKSLREFLTSALTKARLPANERRYIAIIGIRSEEPGVSLKPLADALTAFLKCDLAKSRQVIVLDRNYLQWLTKEEKLAELQLKLKGSVALIDGGIRRNPDKPGMLASISLVGVDNKPLHHFSFEFEKKSPAELREIFASKIGSAAGVELSVVATQDPKGEAATLLEQAHLSMSNGEMEEATLLAEAAFALQPTVAMCAEAKEIWHHLYWHFYRNTMAEVAALNDTEKIGLFESEIRYHELALEEWRLSRVELRDKWEGPDYPSRISTDCIGGPLREFEIIFDLGGGRIEELQKEAASLAREEVEIQLCWGMKIAEKTGKYPNSYWESWVNAVRLLGIQHPGLAENKLPGLRRAFNALINPKKFTPNTKWDEAEQVSHLYLVHNPFQNLPLRKGSAVEEDRQIYIPFFRQYKRDPDPIARTFANLILAELDEDAASSAIAALEAFASLDPKHPCRTYSQAAAEKGYFSLIAASLLSAQSTLSRSGKPELALLSEKILSPLLRDDSDSRMLIFWRHNFSAWIRAVQGLGRLDEAKGITSRVLARLSTCNDCDFRYDLESAKGLFENISFELDRQSGSFVVDPIWDKFEFQDVKFETPIRSKFAFTCQDGKFYVVSDSEADSRFLYKLQVFSIPDGGRPLHTATYTSTKGIFLTSNFANIGVLKDRVYVGTMDGLLEFSMSSSQGRLITESDGLPANPISALAVLNGKLYAAHRQQLREIGASGLSVLNPETGRWNVIASSSAKIDNPLSNRGNYVIDALFPDEERNCVRIYTYFDAWQFFPEANKFEPIKPPGTWVRLQNSVTWWPAPHDGAFITLYPLSGEIRLPGGIAFVSRHAKLSLKQPDDKPPLMNPSREFGPAYPLADGWLIVGFEQIYIIRQKRLSEAAISLAK